MMSNRFDVCAPRKKKDGGTFWVKCGTAWQNDKGIQVVFDALPLPDEEGRCVVNLFEPRDRDEQHKASLNRNAPQGGYAEQLNDDIPF